MASELETNIDEKIKELRQLMQSNGGEIILFAHLEESPTSHPVWLNCAGDSEMLKALIYRCFSQHPALFQVFASAMDQMLTDAEQAMLSSQTKPQGEC